VVSDILFIFSAHSAQLPELPQLLEVLIQNFQRRFRDGIVDPHKFVFPYLYLSNLYSSEANPVLLNDLGRKIQTGSGMHKK
jgi:hypothetical protein